MLRTQNLETESNSAFLTARNLTKCFEMQRELHARNRVCTRAPSPLRFAFPLESFTAMRRGIADWTAAALAVAILGLGGLVVIKPALDHWDDVYRADPFVVGTTTQKVQKRLPAIDGRQTRPRVSRTTTTTTEEASSLPERLLGKSGTLALRLGLVALVAWLAAALLQRAILGNYALRIGARSRSHAQGAGPQAERRALRTLPRRPTRPSSPCRTATPCRRPSRPRPRRTSRPRSRSSWRSRREEMGLSQRELAKRAGISHTVISRVEGGEHSPSPKTLERLADALS